MNEPLNDSRVRGAAFAWLAEQAGFHGAMRPRRILADGFVLDEQRVPQVGPEGIFKPQVLHDASLSITTASDDPYNDAFGRDGLLR